MLESIPLSQNNWKYDYIFVYFIQTVPSIQVSLYQSMSSWRDAEDGDPSVNLGPLGLARGVHGMVPWLVVVSWQLMAVLESVPYKIASWYRVMNTENNEKAKLIVMAMEVTFTI